MVRQKTLTPFSPIAYQIEVSCVGPGLAKAIDRLSAVASYIGTRQAGRASPFT